MTAGASALLVFIGAGAAGLAALTKNEPRVVTAIGRDSATTIASAPPSGRKAETGEPPALSKGFGDAAIVPGGRRISNEADRTATRVPRAVGAGKQQPGAAGGADLPEPPVAGSRPMVTTQTITETRDIPYNTRFVRDPSLPRGQKRVQTQGVPGVETLRYLVTYSDGSETGRRLLDSTVTRQPQQQVIAFGSRGWPGRGHRRECGPELDPCLPLGRAACPHRGSAESGAVQIDGSVSLLGGDLSRLDPNLDGLELEPGLVC